MAISCSTRQFFILLGVSALVLGALFFVFNSNIPTANAAEGDGCFYNFQCAKDETCGSTLECTSAGECFEEGNRDSINGDTYECNSGTWERINTDESGSCSVCPQAPDCSRGLECRENDSRQLQCQKGNCSYNYECRRYEHCDKDNEVCVTEGHLQDCNEDTAGETTEKWGDTYRCLQFRESYAWQRITHDEGNSCTEIAGDDPCGEGLECILRECVASKKEELEPCEPGQNDCEGNLRCHPDREQCWETEECTVHSDCDGEFDTCYSASNACKEGREDGFCITKRCDTDCIGNECGFGSFCDQPTTANPGAEVPDEACNPAEFSEEEEGLVPCGGQIHDEDGNLVGQECLCEFRDIFILIHNLIDDFIITILAPLLAVLMSVVGGFYVLLAGGNPSRVKTGQQIFKWAILGYLLILSSWVVVNTIFQFLGLAEWLGPDNWQWWDLDV